MPKIKYLNETELTDIYFLVKNESRNKLVENISTLKLAISLKYGSSINKNLIQYNNAISYTEKILKLDYVVDLLFHYFITSLDYYIYDEYISTRETNISDEGELYSYVFIINRALRDKYFEGKEELKSSPMFRLITEIIGTYNSELNDTIEITGSYKEKKEKHSYMDKLKGIRDYIKENREEDITFNFNTIKNPIFNFSTSINSGQSLRSLSPPSNGNNSAVTFLTNMNKGKSSK